MQIYISGINIIFYCLTILQFWVNDYYVIIIKVVTVLTEKSQSEFCQTKSCLKYNNIFPIELAPNGTQFGS